MEIASQEDPTPINTSYGNSGGGHGNMIHHHHANSAPSSLNITTSNPPLVSSTGNGLGKNHDHSHHHHVGYNIMVSNNNIKKEKPVVIKYKECLKNHAASMGGNAVDGCGEFMPSGEEGSIQALTCSACNCHRNFHRRETQGEENTFFTSYFNHHQPPPPPQRKLMFHHPHHKMINSPLPQQMIMPIGVATAGSNSESEDLMEEDGGGSLTFRQPPPPPPPPYSYGHNQKKRFRTKFTQEQKEKMMNFAERVGWKIQRQEESVVQQFCQEIGIRRRVLKVWMHNNKHNLSKKSIINVNNNVELSAGNTDINNATTENLASTSP